MNFYDLFKVYVINAYIPIPDHIFSFGNFYVQSSFLEHLLQDIDCLFKIIIIPPMDTYVISISLLIISLLALEGKVGILFFDWQICLGSVENVLSDQFPSLYIHFYMLIALSRKRLKIFTLNSLYCWWGLKWFGIGVLTETYLFPKYWQLDVWILS